MNHLMKTRKIRQLSENELISRSSSSWHDQYKDSAWIYFGGMCYDLSEGDILCIFSECGEILHMRLVRDKDTGKSKGFGFVCFEDQRSTVLAVDNLNGIKVVHRTLRVDHVAKYKIPKHELDKVRELDERMDDNQMRDVKIKRPKDEPQEDRVPFTSVKQEPQEEMSERKRKRAKKEKKRRHSSCSDD